MKPVLSIILRPSALIPPENLRQVARNILNGLDKILSSNSMRCTLFFDGPMLEAMNGEARPLFMGKIKSAVKDGRMEILGGSFNDSMLPLFPSELQALQIKKHQGILKKLFSLEPSGFCSASMVWEMEMTELLEKSGFEYALVGEGALQEALGRSTPMSGWWTIEDKGSLQRIIPVSEALSKAIAEDDFNWMGVAEPYCRGGKAAVVMLEIPSKPGDIVPFMERLVDFVETNELQTWTVGHSLIQQESEGSICFLSSVGPSLGLPPSARTCRELLVRRPEINSLHKSVLAAYHRGKFSSRLDDKDRSDFYDRLCPLMALRFYADSPLGMRSPHTRWQAHNLFIDVLNWLDETEPLQGLRVEVSDFLLQGRKLITAENTSFAALLDYATGGILKNLFFKVSKLNLLSSWRDDAEPSVAFLDFFLPNTDLSAQRLEQALLNRENILDDSYDYQIKRTQEGADISLSGEQATAVADKKYAFQVEKNISIRNDQAAFGVDYKVSNSLYADAKGFFGSLLELGMRSYDNRSQSVCINGSAIKWDMSAPMIFPEAKSLEIRDRYLGCVLHLDFATPASLFLGPIFGASQSAAPEEFQGILIFPFWKVSMESLGAQIFGIQTRISRR